MKLNTNTLIKNSSISIFSRYAIPSFISTIVASAALLIDGLFVAKYVSSNAFAAINIVWPIYCIGYGFYTMMTIGSIAIAGKFLGENKIRRANLVFSLTILSTLTIATLPIFILFLLRDYVLPIFGAHGELLPLANEYFPGVALSVFFAGMSYVLNQFARLNGSPKYASASFFLAASVHIILAIIFVGINKWGLKGAALATVCSHISSFIMMLIYFIRPSCKIKIVRIYGGYHYIIKGAMNGFSEFLSQASNGIIPWFFNITAYSIAGNMGILAYSVANYAMSFFGMFSYALAEALQPLISISFGAKLKIKMTDFLKIALTSVLTVALTAMLIFILKPHILVDVLFIDVVTDVYNTGIRFLRMTTIAFFGIGFNILMSAYYTSVQKAGASATVASLRSIILPIIFIIILPKFFGIMGLALVLPLGEIITIIVSICLFKNRSPKALLKD